MGDSDLAGDVSLELAGERPTVVADLRSQRLDFDDLGVLVGAPPDTEPGETASATQRQAAAAAKARTFVLPDQPFGLPKLSAIDARIKLEAATVAAKILPLERMSLSLTLADGRITFEPLRFAVAEGELDAVIDLDSRENLLEGSVDLSLKRLNLDRLLSQLGIEVAGIELTEEGAGILDGRARLETRGRSMHELAAAADGELAFVMGGGRINALIIEAIGLDVGEALGIVLTEPDEGSATTVPVQCFIGRFDVQQGVVKNRGPGPRDQRQHDHRPRSGRPRRRDAGPRGARRRRRPGRDRARSPPCCRASSSPRAPRTRTPAACWTPGSRWPWRATATPAPASPRRCR